MARIARKPQKVFASSASNNGVFGSAQDNTKILTNDIVTLQSKPAYLTGWLDAVIGSRKFPPLEEFQSLNYINTYQLAYILQEGIAEYDSATTYYQNSIVKKPGTYELYGSVTDNNTGNALSDPVNWEFLQDLSLTYQQATTTDYGIVRLADEADIVPGSSSTDVATAAQLVVHGFTTGDGKETWLSTLQAGWIWADGKTIGNASSNATNRANADTQALFYALWNDAAYNYTGTTATGAALQVRDSAGVAVAKGASAAADFAANRTIAVIDKRGRVSAGKDNMGGTAAGRLSGQPGGVNGTGLGNSGGAESHTLVINEMPKHNHAPSDTGNFLTLGPSNPFNYGGGTRNFNVVATTTDAGNDAPHNNVQPTIVCNYMIKL